MQLLRNVKLTKTQQQVLAIACNSEQDVNASIPTTSNHAAAVKLLTRLGVLTMTNGAMNVTEVGVKLGQHLGIMDASGNLTDTGTQLLPTDGDQDAMGGAGGEIPAMGGVPPAEDDFGFEDPAAGAAPPEPGQEQEEVNYPKMSLMRSLLNRN